MKKVAIFFSTFSQWTEYHLIAASLFLLGLFMGFTSEETGPIAPMVMFFGTYVVFAAIIMEAMLALRLFVAWAFGRYLDRQSV